MGRERVSLGYVAQEYDPSVPVESLEPHPRNVNEGDVGAISETMDALGFFGACLVQRSSRRIIAGKHRWLTVKALGGESVPVLWADVDDDIAVRIMLADNRTARLGHDDDQALAALLTDLAQGTDRGLSGTGFDGDALDALLADLHENATVTRGAGGGEAERCSACGAPLSGR